MSDSEISGKTSSSADTASSSSSSSSDSSEKRSSDSGAKYKTGLWIGSISAILCLFLFMSGFFSSFDTYLTGIIFQHGFNVSEVRNNILIVKKDQATSQLLQKNPDRAEFASLFNFLGKAQHIKPARANRISRTPVFSIDIGIFKNQKHYPIRTSFSSWYNDADNVKEMIKKNPSFTGFFSFVKVRENIWPKSGAVPESPLGGNPLKELANTRSPLLLPTLLTDWSGETTSDKDEFFASWSNVFANIVSSTITAKVKLLSSKSSFFKFTLYLKKANLVQEFTVPPASVIGFDFILQGKKGEVEDGLLIKALKESDSSVVLAEHTKKEEVFKVAHKEYMLASSTVIDTDKMVSQSKKQKTSNAAVLNKFRKVEIVSRKITPNPIFVPKNVELAMIDMSVGNKSYVTEVPLFIVDQKNKIIDPSFGLMVSMSYLDRKHGLVGKPNGYVSEMKQTLNDILPKLINDSFQGPLNIKDISIPVNRSGRMLIDFVGSTRKGRMQHAAFKSASFYECFDDELLLKHVASATVKNKRILMPKKAHIRTLTYGSNKGDKICLVGPFEITDFDYFPTPLSLASPMQIEAQPLMGIEIHANVIANILEKRALRHPQQWKTAMLLIVLTLMLGVLLDFSSPLMGVVITSLFLMGAVGMGKYSYQGLQEVFHFGALLASFSFTWLMSTLLNYVKQRSKAQATKQMFSKFVAADVVQYMLEHPELVKPGGEKVELTIFFSDVAGFTSISEALSPENLVLLLNEYLGAMTDILFEYGGTLDKFIGDAVMAFWNHPKKQEDHALRGCLCALAMQDKITELQKDWAKRGLPRVAARAGLNSAEVVVGYMGSDRAQMNFTCMGDGVNLAARLEGANKEYGTLMMMGDATYQQVKHRITGRFLDFLAVKGKKEPVKVIELVSEKGKEPPEWDELIELYDKAMQLHLDRKWEEAIDTFEKLLARWPDDGPSKTYIKRCHEYMENPPPEKWDGRYILTHK